MCILSCVCHLHSCTVFNTVQYTGLLGQRQKENVHAQYGCSSFQLSSTHGWLAHGCRAHRYRELSKHTRSLYLKKLLGYLINTCWLHTQLPETLSNYQVLSAHFFFFYFVTKCFSITNLGSFWAFACFLPDICMNFALHLQNSHPFFVSMLLLKLFFSKPSSVTLLVTSSAPVAKHLRKLRKEDLSFSGHRGAHL